MARAWPGLPGALAWLTRVDIPCLARDPDWSRQVRRLSAEESHQEVSSGGGGRRRREATSHLGTKPSSLFNIALSQLSRRSLARVNTVNLASLP